MTALCRVMKISFSWQKCHSAAVDLGKQLRGFASRNIAVDKIDNNKITQQQKQQHLNDVKSKISGTSTTLNDGSERKKIGSVSLSPGLWNGRSFCEPNRSICVRVSLCCILSCNEYTHTTERSTIQTLKSARWRWIYPKCSIFRCMLLWQVRWIYYILSKRHTRTCKRKAREREKYTRT